MDTTTLGTPEQVHFSAEGAVDFCRPFADVPHALDSHTHVVEGASVDLEELAHHTPPGIQLLSLHLHVHVYKLYTQ